MMRYILVVLAVLLLASPAAACTGAAAEGMGYAYLAVADGIDAVYWAPDRLLDTDPGVSFCQSSGVDNYVWTLTINQSTWGCMVWRDLLGDTNLIISAPVFGSGALSLGVLLVVRPENVLPVCPGLSCSLTSENATITFRYDGAIRIGAAAKTDGFVVSGELYYLPSYHIPSGYILGFYELRFGMQLKLTDFLTARFGINYHDSALYDIEVPDFCFGLSVSIGIVKLDYSVLGYNNHRIELSMKF